MTPFYSLTILSDLLDGDLYICGDSNGDLGIITAECWEDAKDILQCPKLLRVVKWDKAYPCQVMPDPTGIRRHLPFQHEDIWDVETIELTKWLIQNRWIIRCGYGSRTRTWVVREGSVRDLRPRKRRKREAFVQAQLFNLLRRVEVLERKLSELREDAQG